MARLTLATNMGADTVTCKTDSQLIVGHLDNTFQVKDPLLLQYYHVVQGMLNKFKTTSVKHVSRSQNSKANLLSKLATTKIKGQNHTVIHATLDHPTVTLMDCNTIEAIAPEDEEWMTPIMQFIQHGNRSAEDNPIMRKKASLFLIGQELYRRLFQPFIKMRDKPSSSVYYGGIAQRNLWLTFRISNHGSPGTTSRILLADCKRRLRKVR